MSNRVIRITGDPSDVQRQILAAIAANEMADKVRLGENVVAVLQDLDKEITTIYTGRNIVTNDGDQYYAEAAVGSPSWSVAGMRLGSNFAGGTGKGKTDVNTFFGTGKATDSTYPKANDTNANNTGKGIDVVSWSASWATGENNGTAMDEGAIVDNLTTPTKALTHFEITTPITKTSSETLQMFVNHTMLGV